MIPDCRIDDVYNYDFLDPVSKICIDGFDFAAEEIVSLFQNNLDVYKQELTETLEEGDTPDEDDVYAARSDLYDILSENSKLLSHIILHWLEMSRDALITTAIDDMDETEYNINREQAFKENKDKEYFDSRHWCCTGEKQRSDTNKRTLSNELINDA